MKKHVTILFAAAVMLAVCAFIVPAPAHADDGVPTVVALTFPGGSANVGTNGTMLTSSNVYSAGLTAPARSTLQPIAVQYSIGGTLLADATLSFRRSAAGPVWWQVAIPSNTASGVAFASNTWYWIRSDRLHATLSATNAATADITASER